MFLNYWKQVGQMVSKVRITLFWEAMNLEWRIICFSKGITMKYQLLYLSSIIRTPFNLPSISFRSKNLANILEEKAKQRKKTNDMQCQVSSQSANPHLVDSLSTSCNPIKCNSAQVFTGMTNTKAYFPLGLLKN